MVKSLKNFVLVVLSKQNLKKEREREKDKRNYLTYKYIKSAPHALGHNYYFSKSWKHLEMFL